MCVELVQFNFIVSRVDFYVTKTFLKLVIKSYLRASGTFLKVYQVENKNLLIAISDLEREQGW